MADVFISYSRKDKNFVRGLHEAFSECKRETWVDWQDIPPTAEWLKEVYSAIVASDTFVFVISPESIASEICNLEIDHAVKHNKRLVPIVHREVDAKTVPEDLAKLNWIFFREGDDFNSAFQSLIKAIDTDLDYVHSHTRLLVRTIEWDSKGSDNSFLLRGNDLQEAEEWLAQSGGKEPRPTSIQTQYITTSRRNATKRQRVMLGAVTFGLIVAVVLALVALYQRNEAIEQSKISLSRQLAAQSINFLNSDRADLGLLLSLEANRTSGTVEAKSSLLAGLAQNLFLDIFLHGHILDTVDIAFSPDGNILASGGCETADTLGLCEQYGIRLWDVRTWRQISQFLTPHTNRLSSLAFSSDGNLLATGSWDHTIILWSVATGKQVGQPLKSQTAGIQCLAFSPNNSILASGTAQGLVLWDAQIGRQISQSFRNHSGDVNSVAFSPDGNLLASAGDDGLIILWDVSDPQMTVQPVGKQLVGHTQDVISVAFSLDEKLLASAGWDERVILWDLKTREPIKTLIEGKDVSRVTFDPRGARLAVSINGAENEGEVLLLDIETGEQLTSLNGKGRVTFNPDGTMLAAGGSNGDIILWDLTTRHRLTRSLSVEDEHRVLSLAFSPDGKILASGGRDNRINLWDIETGQQIDQPLKEHTGDVYSLAFSPDGSLLASGSQDKTVILWDMRITPIEPVGLPLTGHTSSVYSGAFSRNGQMFASGGFDNTIILWDVVTGEPTGKPILAPEEVYSMDISPDGTLLAAATEDSSILVWDITTDEPVGKVLGTHLSTSDGMTSVAFSPDGTLLVSSSLEDTVLWDVATDNPISQPLAGSFTVFSPDGKILASSDFNEVLLLDVETRRPFDQALGAHADYVSAMAFSPNGTLVASASEEGDIILWDVSIESWWTRACHIANRNLTEDEWERFLGSQVYEKTCPDIPDLPPIPLDPVRAFSLAYNYAMQGDVEQAAMAFAQATQLVIETTDAGLSNKICWYGTTTGFAENVLTACEHAIDLNPDHGGYRDSRGLARALIGDYTGAIEDFKFYVEWSKQNNRYERRGVKREVWIKELQAGRNPFDAVDLRALRNEAWDF